jgi:hypothetical protein
MSTLTPLVHDDVGPAADDGSTAPPPEVQLAQDYIEARNAYDADRARELVADEFWTSEAPDGFRDVDTMELAFDSHRVHGFA